jgi:N-methylhydantoinase B/oxoprolinase/acetone carboxylase alpha subunit
VVAVTVVKRGERIEFDFSGSAAQTASALNCSWLDAKTGVMLALNLMFLRHGMPNSGSLRDFDFVIPAGAILNAYPPASTMMYFSIVDAVMRATIVALDEVLGADAIAFDTPMGGGTGHRASGTTPDGIPGTSRCGRQPDELPEEARATATPTAWAPARQNMPSLCGGARLANPAGARG